MPRPPLTLVHITPPRSAWRQGWQLIWSPRKWPPFEPDLWLVEQDVWGLLGGEEDVIRDPGGSLETLAADMLRERPRLPGSVRLVAHHPPRLELVIYDLEQQPCTRPEWLRAALSAAFLYATQEGIRDIALPPLGSRPGALPEAAWIQALDATLQQHPAREGRLWLIEPAAARHSMSSGHA